MLRDIRSNSMDFATLALWPFAIGLLVTVLYYSRYRIFSINLLSPQYILLGIYVIVIYAGLPFLVFRVSAQLPARWQITAALVVLMGMDFFLLYLLRSIDAAPHVSTPLHLIVLQLALFLKPPRNIDLSTSLGTLRAIAVLCLASAHFAFFFVGNIPQYLGGAKPVEVRVLPADPKIFQSRFIRSSLPPATGERQFFKERLLFESADEFFFLRVHTANIKVNGKAMGGSHPITSVVLRVPKRLVDKIEYNTPHGIALRVEGGISVGAANEN